jgi:fimbrial isopeptide formation D2 family protein/LPXTG-motif cell wall-anchored protein
MKMKQFRKIVSLFMALVMVMAMGITVFADGSTAKHTITINYSKTGHTYEAYQVFAGNVSEDGTLTNVKWGSGVDGDALLEALQKLDAYNNCKSAQDVSEVLQNFSSNSSQLDAFADVVGQNLSETLFTSGSESEVKDSTGNVTGYAYEIEVTGDGYYLVKDKNGSVTADSDAYTKYILNVVANVSIDAKADAPTINKVIEENSDEKQYNQVAIGDVVNYKVTSRVPAMDGYNKYYFVVNDTMSKGLTFNNDVVITLGGTTLSANDYTVTTSDLGTDGTAIKIVFKNFIGYNDKTNAAIVIKYSATLNENAVIGSVGNPNKVDLLYSNNPNYDYQGTDEPLKDEPTGTTPESMTITYATEIEITKVDATNHDTTLAGATFKIEGTSLNIVLVTGEEYVTAESVTASTVLVNSNVYYKLNDGTYTTTDPSGDNIDTSKYESTTQTYKLVKVENKVIQKTSPVSYEVTSDENGILKFTGLSAGTYTITETQSPSGYNLLTDPITVEISWAQPTSPTLPTAGTEASAWTATYTLVDGGTSNNATIDSDGHVTFSIENNKGTVLPSTGGTGVKVLYTVGAILAIGAAVLLITRRRMKIMN